MMQRVAEMAALPQSQQGDRPAFLAALRYLASMVGGDILDANVQRAETERLIGSRAAAGLLFFGISTAAKWRAVEVPVSAYRLDKAERPALPASRARVVRLADDIHAFNLRTPWEYLEVTAKQLEKNAKALDIEQLRGLAEAGVASGHTELAYFSTAA